jgi:hypothetical protein
LIEYVLIDADGLPRDTGYLDLANPPKLAPGKSLMATNTLYFTGSTERLRLVTSY